MDLDNQDEDDMSLYLHSSLAPPQPPSLVSQNINLAFPGPLNISLAVDASPGCGGIAWPAGEVLSSYLTRRGREGLDGRIVLELGSGTGLVGLVAGMLGATAYITDQAPLLPIMRKNVYLNDLSDRVHVFEYDWGVPPTSSLPSPSKVDLILAADCVYFEPAFPLLVQTLVDLTPKGSSAEILFCYKKRRKADKRFFTLLKKHFEWSHVSDDPDKSTYSRDAISLLRLFRKHRTIVEKL